MGILEFLEQTQLSTFIRESDSLLAFPTFLCFHTLGLSLVTGTNVVVAVRVLGIAPGIPLKSLRKMFPFSWAGLIISALSGFGLTMAKATTLSTNPILLVKLVLIAFTCVLMWRLDKKVFRDPNYKEAESQSGRVTAVLLLVLWTAIMTAGRLIAYSMTIFSQVQ